MNKIFNESSDKLLYSPMTSIYPSRVNLHTEYISNIAEIFFKILNQSNIEYYVFAGSSIGLLRNAKSIPWVDDYDIIIFDNDLPKFDKIISLLKKNQFIVKTVNKNTPTLKPIKKINTTFKPIFNTLDGTSKVFAGYVIGSPRYSLNGIKTSFFQVDVFVSRNESGKLKSIASWGLYHKKDVPISYVKPPRFVEFDGIKIPFFNHYEKDIELEYGNVLQTSVIHINHGREKIIIPKKWEETYAEFETYKNIAISNTKKLLEIEEKNNEEIINNEENNSKNNNNNFDLFFVNLDNNNNLFSDINLNVNVTELLNNNKKNLEDTENYDNDIYDEKHEDIIKTDLDNKNIKINNDNLDFFVDIEKNNYIDLLRYISKFYNSVKNKELHIFNSTNILYIFDIKYYFKDIKINFHINNISALENIRFFIDKVDIITLSEKNILQNCENYLNNLVINNKPIIKCDMENSNSLIKNNNLEEENYLFDKKEKNRKINPRINMNKIINIKTTTKSPINNNKSNLVTKKTNLINNIQNSNNLSNIINEQINNIDSNKNKSDNINKNDNINKITKINTKFKSINSIKVMKIK